MICDEIPERFILSTFYSQKRSPVLFYNHLFSQIRLNRDYITKTISFLLISGFWLQSSLINYLFASLNLATFGVSIRRSSTKNIFQCAQETLGKPVLSLYLTLQEFCELLVSNDSRRKSQPLMSQCKNWLRSFFFL